MIACSRLGHMLNIELSIMNNTDQPRLIRLRQSSYIHFLHRDALLLSSLLVQNPPYSAQSLRSALAILL